jgi:hypothetical protein
MNNYQFQLIDRNRQEPLPEDARRRLLDRPWVHLETSLQGTDDLLRTAVLSHRQRYPRLDEGFLDTAIRCFLQIRQRTKEKPPATGELLAWLQVLSIATGCRPEVLDTDLRKLPFLSTLIKHPEDLLELQRMS